MYRFFNKVIGKQVIYFTQHHPHRFLKFNFKSTHIRAKKIQQTKIGTKEKNIT